MSIPQDPQQETDGWMNSATPNLQMLNTNAPTPMRTVGQPGRIFQQSPMYQSVRVQPQRVFYRTVSPQVQARMNQNTPSQHPPSSSVENAHSLQNRNLNQVTPAASASFYQNRPMANVQYTSGGVHVLQPQPQTMGSAPHAVVVQQLPHGESPGQVPQHLIQNGNLNQVTPAASASFYQNRPMANVQYISGGVHVLQPQPQTMGSAPHAVVVQQLPHGESPGQVPQHLIQNGNLNQVTLAASASFYQNRPMANVQYISGGVHVLQPQPQTMGSAPHAVVVQQLPHGESPGQVPQHLIQNGNLNQVTPAASASFYQNRPMANVQYTSGVRFHVLRPQTATTGMVRVCQHSDVQQIPSGVYPGQLQQPQVTAPPGYVIPNAHPVAIPGYSICYPSFDALLEHFFTSGLDLVLRLRQAVISAIQLFSDHDNLRISDDERACLESGMYSLPFSTPPGSPDSDDLPRPPIYKPQLAVQAEQIQKEIDSIYDDLKNETKKLSTVPIEFVPKSMLTCENLMNVGSMCYDWEQTYTNSLDLSDYIHVRVPLINAMNEEIVDLISTIPRTRKHRIRANTVTNLHLRLDKILQNVKISEYLKMYGITTEIVDRGLHYTVLLATYTLRKEKSERCRYDVMPVPLLRVIFLFSFGKLQLANILAPTESVYRNVDGRYDPTVPSRFLVYQQLSVNGRTALDNYFDGSIAPIHQVLYFQIFSRAINSKCRLCGHHLKNFLPPTYLEQLKSDGKPSFIHPKCRLE